jgi:sec-independent protein translocase protein TatA
MALIGYEWLIALGVLLVVFLWGPQKLPELAKSLGVAKKEFEKSSKEISSIATSVSTSHTERQQDPLIVAAKSVGITTEGKTRDEIAKQIVDKAEKKQG